MFVTAKMGDALDHFVQEVYYEGAYNGAENMDRLAAARLKELHMLVRAEAINLADQIIGKDRLIHSHVDLQEGEDIMDKEDKAVFDFQVKQRIQLAAYQNPEIKQ